MSLKRSLKIPKGGNQNP